MRALEEKPLKVYQCTQGKSPLVAPEGVASIAEYDEKLAKSKKHRNYVEHTSYDGRKISDKNWRTISIKENLKHQKLLFNVQNLDGTFSVVEVSHMSNYSGGDDICRNFRDASTLLRKDDYNARDRTMAALGRLKQPVNGQVISRVTRTNEGHAEAFASANRAMREYCSSVHPELVAEIDEAMGKLGVVVCDEMGGSGGLAPSGDISINLGNESHNDVYDLCRAVSTWVEVEVGDATGWYYLMPNVSIDGDPRPVAIELGTGVTIVWDGRIVAHCSSKPTVGEGNSVHGCFLGVSCTNKYGHGINV